MKRTACSTCRATRPFKRALGFGTLFAVLVTGGLWLCAIPFYKLRCATCGAEYMRPGAGEIRVQTIVILALLTAPMIAAADEKTRIDRFTKDSARRGYVIIDEKSGRVDTYDKDSKRTGYGVVRPDGRVDRYDTEGRRRGSITPRK